MLISCISENKLKGRTSIFYRKTGKDKPIRDVDKNYTCKHYLLCYLYQCRKLCENTNACLDPQF